MHFPDVREEMVENFWPQYLHAYWDFSLPSYNACLPSYDPSGCLMHLPDVREEMVGNFWPQYLQ